MGHALFGGKKACWEAAAEAAKKEHSGKHDHDGSVSSKEPSSYCIFSGNYGL